MSPSSPYVLVVDDDADIREIVTLVLEANGYRVATAADGAEALALLRREPGCSAVVLDLMMPGLNGWEFRAIQRSDPAIAPIPVVVISSVRNLRDHAEQLGAAALLQKPVDMAELLSAVERFY